MILGPASEELRKKLLQQEFSMRKKQPEHWAKTKYRKYALRPIKKETPKSGQQDTATKPENKSKAINLRKTKKSKLQK